MVAEALHNSERQSESHIADVANVAPAAGKNSGDYWRKKILAESLTNYTANNYTENSTATEATEKRQLTKDSKSKESFVIQQHSWVNGLIRKNDEEPGKDTNKEYQKARSKEADVKTMAWVERVAKNGIVLTQSQEQQTILDAQLRMESLKRQTLKNKGESWVDYETNRRQSQINIGQHRNNTLFP